RRPPSPTLFPYTTLFRSNSAPERAPAQVTLTPRVIQIDQVKCAELQSSSDQKKDRLLVYFNGYVDGMRRHTVWDERQVGELVERDRKSIRLNSSHDQISY